MKVNQRPTAAPPPKATPPAEVAKPAAPAAAPPVSAPAPVAKTDAAKDRVVQNQDRALAHTGAQVEVKANAQATGNRSVMKGAAALRLTWQAGGEPPRTVRQQLADLDTRIKSQAEGPVKEQLKQERVSLTQELVRAEVGDPTLAEVVSRYVSDKNATDLQALLLGGSRTQAILDRIESTRAWPNAEPSHGKALADRLLTLGSRLFVNDMKAFNLDAAGHNRLDGFIAARRQSAEFRLGAKEIKENRAAVTQVADGILGHVRASLEPKLTAELAAFAAEARAQGASVIGHSQRTKSSTSLVNKIMDRDKERTKAEAAGKKVSAEPYTIASATDLLGGRVVVADLKSLEAVMKLVEQKYGGEGRILEKENKFIKNNGTDNPYRAVHYIIKADDGHCFELQLKTEASMVSSDLYHNAVYKPDILNLPEDQRRGVGNYCWQSVNQELSDYADALSTRST